MIPTLRWGRPRSILLLATILLASCSGAPAIETDLPQLEKAFDAGPAAAAPYLGKTALVRATVASVQKDRLTLESIYLLNVQAYFAGTPKGYAKGDQVAISCEVDQQEYPTGLKPLLKNCYPAA